MTQDNLKNNGPGINNEDEVVIISFQIPKKLAVRFRIVASKKNISRSELFRRILVNELYFLEKDSK